MKNQDFPNFQTSNFQFQISKFRNFIRETVDRPRLIKKEGEKLSEKSREIISTFYDNVVEDPEVIERIFDDVGNIDYIYQVIQESVDEVTEEQMMLQQQELV